MNTFKSILSGAAIVCLLAGCKPGEPKPASKRQAISVRALDPMAVVLASHIGDGRLDFEIRQQQEQIRAGRQPELALERLGWLFVAKARASFDAGYYKLAEQCALALEKQKGLSESARSNYVQAAMLLRGHVLQNMHRFKEAEVIASELAARRGLPFDYALLGDTLMEQGQLKKAAEAYQQMVDLRPGFEAYSRIAHIRWLTGDLDGAVQMMQTAVNSTSPADADTTAWANIRLANLQLLSGNREEALRNCETALALCPDYPPALLLREKISLIRGDGVAAVADLERAAEQNPLPEYQWALAEALRSAGREEAAVETERDLVCRGEATDPRTLSLHLATRGENSELAVRLAKKELQQRADIFTHDALAWALAAAGRIDEARPHLEQALAEGTQDARIFFHAAVIESRAGRFEDAQRWFTRAAAMADLLLPSEQSILRELPKNFAAVQADPAANTSSPSGL